MTATVLVPVAADVPGDVFRTAGSLLAQPGTTVRVAILLSPAVPACVPVAAALARRAPEVTVRRLGAATVAGLLAEALPLVDTPLVGVLEPGDLALDDALARLVDLAGRTPPARLAYADEQWDADGGLAVRLKPDRSPTRLLGDDYVGRPALVSTEALRAAGGWTVGAGTALEWDTALRLLAPDTDPVPGAPDGGVRHLPAVAVHRARPPAVDEADARAVLDRHLARTRQEASVVPAGTPGRWRVRRPLPSPLPEVSVVVPTAGARRVVDARPGGANGGGSGRGDLGPAEGPAAVDLVDRCLEGLLTGTSYPAWTAEVVVSAHAPAGLEDRVTALDPRVRAYRLAPGPFNFSESVNAGVGAGTAPLVLLLNDDVVPLHEDWLTAMVAALQEPGVEVVGAKLLLPDGRVQHAGVAHDDRFHPTHPHMLEPDGPGYFGDLDVAVDYAAVTAACLLTTREAFVRVGGLWPGLPVAYGDVDYCWKVAATGGRCVLEPAAVLRHDESSTRGPGIDPAELGTYLGQWGEHARRDLSVHFRRTKS